MHLSDIAPSPLESWLRDRYFSARIDISSSGVETYSLGQLRTLLGISDAELDRITFRDSPSLGGDRLRAAVTARFLPDGSPPDNVLVTHGSTEGILLALAAIIRPGDEIIVLKPVYQALHSVATALRATIRTWDLDESAGFRPDLDRLRGLLGPRTRAVIVNFPHNPTGVTLDPATYADFLALVARYGCYLVWDAAFAELVHDRPALPEPYPTYDRSVSLGTLSKTYGLPGLRVGWCIGPSALLARMVEVRDYVTLNTSPLSETLAARVLESADLVMRPRLAQAWRNQDLMAEWLAGHPGLVDGRLPDGGVTMFPRFAGSVDVTALCDSLTEHRGVLTVPGICFGHRDRMRIGFGGPTSELVDGLSELDGALRDLPVHQAREAHRTA